jgi:hypothetical protein
MAQPSLKNRDIDALYNAIRARLGKGSGGQGGGQAGPPGPQGPPGPKGVVWKGAWALAQPYETGDIVYHPSPDGCGGQLLTYFCTFAEESNAGNEPAPGGNAPYWWEMTNGALIIDGTRAMVCDLDMNSFEVNNVEAIDFTLAPTHTHAEGGVHWDGSTPSLAQPVADLSGDTGIVTAPMLSVYVKVYNNWFPLTITAGRSLRVVGSGTPIPVEPVYASDPTRRDHVLGIAAQNIPPGGTGWACIKGYVRVLGAFGGNGPEYLDNGFPSALTPAIPDLDRGCLWTIRMGYSPSTDVMIVDVEQRPGLQELSDVTSEANRAPLCGDVLVRTLAPVGPGSACGVWEPSGLWTEVVLDFGLTDPPSDMKVFTIVGDPRVKLSSIITMAPSAKPVAPRQEDEAEFDIFACSCIPTVEQPTMDDPPSEFRAYVHSLRGKIVGEYRFHYTVSNPATWNCVLPGLPS